MFNLRDKIKKARAEMVAALITHGTDKATAEHAVGKIGDGQILAWLMLHGPDIAKWIKLIFGL